MENSISIQVFQLPNCVSCCCDLKHFGIAYENILYTSFGSASLADLVENDLGRKKG